MTKRQQIIQHLDELKLAIKSASGNSEILESLEYAIELMAGEDPFQDNEKVYGLGSNNFDDIKDKIVRAVTESVDDCLEDFR